MVYQNSIIRDVHSEDAKALIDIYRPHIETNATSFEIEVPSVSEFMTRIESVTKLFPWLVMSIDNQIAGYAYASPIRTRPAYDWSVEVTVYVNASFQRQGIAKKLYKELFSILEKQGIANLFAVITLPNDASSIFHESLGFKHIGNFENVGYKLNKWWDVGWWQLCLQTTKTPSKIIHYPNLIKLEKK